MSAAKCDLWVANWDLFKTTCFAAPRHCAISNLRGWRTKLFILRKERRLLFSLLTLHLLFLVAPTRKVNNPGVILVGSDHGSVNALSPLYAVQPYSWLATSVYCYNNFSAWYTALDFSIYKEEISALRISPSNIWLLANNFFRVSVVLPASRRIVLSPDARRCHDQTNLPTKTVWPLTWSSHLHAASATRSWRTRMRLLSTAIAASQFACIAFYINYQSLMRRIRASWYVQNVINYRPMLFSDRPSKLVSYP